MTFFFIEQSNEKNKFKLMINNIFNKVETEKKDDRILLRLPLKETIQLKEKQIKKIKKQIQQYNVKNVILSENLYNLKDELCTMNINILNGTVLFKILLDEIIKYICTKINNKMEKINIAVLTNDGSSINKEIIICLAEKVKTINIVTNKKDEFSFIEDLLYKDKGIIVRISNNYRTSLNKTDVIINMDFPENMISKYYIPSKCIIININGGVKIRTKKFSGININGYNIVIPEKYKVTGYNDKYVYESNIIDKEYKLAKRQLLDDNIKIKNLLGEKGVIDNIEFNKL